MGTNSGAWIAGVEEAVSTVEGTQFAGATGAIDGFYAGGISLKNPVVIAPLLTNIPFAETWKSYSGSSYMRMWSCLNVETKSGYALTIETAGGAAGECVVDLKLDRYDAGVPHELWKKTGYVLLGAGQTRNPINISMAVFEHEVSVWVTEPLGEGREPEWTEIGKAADSKYKSGFFGWEGQGEPLYNALSGEDAAFEALLGLSSELVGLELPGEEEETPEMAMML